MIIFIAPRLDNLLDRGSIHARNGNVVAGRETNDTRNSGITFGNENVLIVPLFCGGIGKKRREIVIERECLGVLRISAPAKPHISGTQITAGIVWLYRCIVRWID